MESLLSRLSAVGVGAPLVLLVLACSSSSSTGSSSSSGTSGANVLACTQEADADDTDDDCIAAGKPRKLDCTTASEADTAIAAGCVREDAADTTDFDVCCPKTVEGTKPATNPTPLACEQKADADTDPECADKPATPRKLDCDAADTSAALAAGCVRVSSGSSDVCCPRTVTGTR